MRGRPCAWMLVLLTGCGSSVSGAPDALVDAPAPADAFAAVHDPFPQVPNQGGRVLANLELVTVTPAGYPYAAEVEAFGDWVVGSAWAFSAGASGVAFSGSAGEPPTTSSALSVITRWSAPITS